MAHLAPVTHMLLCKASNEVDQIQTSQERILVYIHGEYYATLQTKYTSNRYLNKLTVRHQKTPIYLIGFAVYQEFDPSCNLFYPSKHNRVFVCSAIPPLTVSPSVTVTAPLACLPMRPVSTTICKIHHQSRREGFKVAIRINLG